mmetsp:Transcript_66350/g.117322  ORF Transcript_66350/g.117322 Transcript_66350/m.117322 type:complete len:251 (+) Transcript_66350:949-1701(+)
MKCTLFDDTHTSLHTTIAISRAPAPVSPLTHATINRIVFPAAKWLLLPHTGIARLQLFHGTLAPSSMTQAIMQDCSCTLSHSITAAGARAPASPLAEFTISLWNTGCIHDADSGLASQALWRIAALVGRLRYVARSERCSSGARHGAFSPIGPFIPLTINAMISALVSVACLHKFLLLRFTLPSILAGSLPYMTLSRAHSAIAGARAVTPRIPVSPGTIPGFTFRWSFARLHFTEQVVTSMTIFSTKSCD